MEKNTILILITYISTVFGKIKHRNDIQTAFKTKNTLKSIFTNTKTFKEKSKFKEIQSFMLMQQNVFKTTFKSIRYFHKRTQRLQKEESTRIGIYPKHKAKILP